MRFWLGGYTADMDGDAEGIAVLRAGEDVGARAAGPLALDALAVRTAGSPSWVSSHPSADVVYAACEADGTVQAFARTGETTLRAWGAPVAVGQAPCHIAIAPDARSLVVACWLDGRVVRVGLDADGRLGRATAAAAAADPYAQIDPLTEDPALAALAALLPETGDQTATEADGDDEPDRVPHAHQTRFLPDGTIVTTDMGFDLVRFWRADGAGLRATQQVVLPQGSGPRHMRLHPSGHLYVVCELSCEVFVLAPDRTGRWSVVSGSTLSPAVLDTDLAAEIALSRDAQYVYAGLRGSDTIAVLRVGGSGDRVHPSALVEAGVRWPRHHVVEHDTLLIAGQLSDEVVSRDLDIRTGVPGRVRHRVAAATPTCLAPVR